MLNKTFQEDQTLDTNIKGTKFKIWMHHTHLASNAGAMERKRKGKCQIFLKKLYPKKIKKIYRKLHFQKVMRKCNSIFLHYSAIPPQNRHS